MDNLAQFDTLSGAGESQETPEVKVIDKAEDDKAKKKNAKDARVRELTDALKKTKEIDPEFDDKRQSISKDIEVVNTLGFGSDGGLLYDGIQKDEETGKEKRKVVPTSEIVGYRVVNNGEESIKYQTEVWTPNAEGIYEATAAEKVLAPGQFADLTRSAMTRFCSQPEISFTLNNGKIIKGSSKPAASLKEQLESFYFKFDAGEDGVTPQVHDDTIKLAIASNETGDWVVTPEFEEAFGFLNNPTEKAEKRTRKSKSKYTSQDLHANLIHRMIEEQGL